MGQHPRILIIEDDADINNIVTSYLSKQDLQCTQAFSGSEARLLLEQAARNERPCFDLVITDLMLPGITGQEIVSLVREQALLPIIVISTLERAADKIELFKLGADDYLVKPFDLDELWARVLVQLRHASKVPQALSSKHLGFKEWTIDLESRSLCAAGTLIKLTRTEFDIIEVLARRPKKVFTKRELYESVWQEESFIEEKAINVHVSNIRAKLKDTGTEHYIETVWGIGFKLTDG